MSDSTTLVELIGLDKLKDLQEHFFKATDFPNSFVDIKGNYVSHAGEAAYACMNIMRKNEEGCRRCVANDIRLTKDAPVKDDLNIYKCHADIWDASAPVIASGKLLGYIFIGQCLTEKPSEPKVKAYAKELGINPEYYWKHYNALPIVSYEKMEQAGKLLFFMASAIAEEALGKDLARLETEQLKKAKQVIIANETRFRELFNNIPSIVVISESIDNGQHFIFKDLNRSGQAYGQVNKEQVFARDVQEVFPQLKKVGLFEVFKRVWKTGEPEAYTGNLCENNILELNIESYVYKLPSGELVTIFEDTTAKMRVEQERDNLTIQLLQSKKMDALGKLTGGIAHDYNNLLGIIQGFTELLNDSLSKDSEQKKYALGIQRTAERGSKLTKKLLQFSRHKASEVSVVNINTLIVEEQLMLEKTLTARIKLALDLAPDLWSVELNADDLEDSIINMCINAMQAMKTAGELTLRTRNERRTIKDTDALNLNAGEYVVLSITDTGSGMDKVTIEKLFDPFYTTKGKDGSGLGLSQVYGFVERSGGVITVYSELDHGTCFSIYFPRTHKTKEEVRPASVDTEVKLSGSEVLLVVDDEKVMVELAYKILAAQGYRVLTAGDGKQALALLKQNTVDLIVTDVIMPNMDGYQLVAQIQKNYPHIKIQMVSGFVDDRHSDVAEESLRKNILLKPYTSYALLTRIRKLLDDTIVKNNLVDRTILVMDDEEDMRSLYKLHLKKLGCKTILASNGNEAIEYYQQSLENNEPIDIIITDLSIPGDLNGKDLAIKIHSLDPDAKIIVASGNSEGPEMLNFRDHGFCAALEKNFDREEIKHTLERVIRAN